jgi:hypothetical protein
LVTHGVSKQTTGRCIDEPPLELLENGALHKAPQKAGLTCIAPILLATRAGLDLKNDRIAGKFVKTKIEKKSQIKLKNSENFSPVNHESPNAAEQRVSFLILRNNGVI